MTLVKTLDEMVAELLSIDRRVASLFSTCCAHEGRIAALEKAIAELAAATVRAPAAAPKCRVLVTSRFKKT